MSSGSESLEILILAGFQCETRWLVLQHINIALFSSAAKVELVLVIK
jgi:hypothetical protein